MGGGVLVASPGAQAMAASSIKGANNAKSLNLVAVLNVSQFIILPSYSPHGAFAVFIVCAG